ncbi:MAG TPA: hypothetical protein VLN49_23775 [Gemmatimonadaceae bacterium]|nr:hypothetical protein [Gemmatimonadaceae bacterium]
MAEALRFPRGVRFPKPAEVPDVVPPDELERLKTATITTGYVYRPPSKAAAMPFFEANAHADRVWALLKAIAESILPAAAAPIFGLKNEDPILGPYTTRAAATGVFEPFVGTLQHDGLFEFGIIFQRAGKTNEVFVRSVKHSRSGRLTPSACVAFSKVTAYPKCRTSSSSTTIYASPRRFHWKMEVRAGPLRTRRCNGHSGPFLGLPISRRLAHDGRRTLRRSGTAIGLEARERRYQHE